MASWNWGISIITFAFGLGFGFFAAYLLIPRSGRIRELEQELEESQAKLKDYRGKVNQHFQKTAELFEDMTDRYRAVYQHMATSAQTLCEEGSAPPKLTLADRERLPPGGTATQKPAASVPEESENTAGAEPAEAHKSKEKTAKDSDDYIGDAPHVPVLDDEVKTTAAEGKQPPPTRAH